MQTTTTFDQAIARKYPEAIAIAIAKDAAGKYNPISLPESFRKDGIRVKVTARLMKHGMSIHLYGSIIEVVNITGQHAVNDKET